MRVKPQRFHGRHVLNRYPKTAWRSASVVSCAPASVPARCIYVRGADNPAGHRRSAPVSGLASCTTSTCCAASSVPCALRPARPKPSHMTQLFEMSTERQVRRCDLHQEPSYSLNRGWDAQSSACSPQTTSIDLDRAQAGRRLDEGYGLTSGKSRLRGRCCVDSVRRVSALRPAEAGTDSDRRRRWFGGR